jgi:hypothetical protein
MYSNCGYLRGMECVRHIQSRFVDDAVTITPEVSS